MIRQRLSQFQTVRPTRTLFLVDQITVLFGNTHGEIWRRERGPKALLRSAMLTPSG